MSNKNNEKQHQTLNLGLLDFNKELSKIVVSNIKKLLIANHMSQNSLCQKLKEYHLDINQNSLSKYLPHQAEQPILPITLVILCCKIFHTTIEDISSPDFQPLENNHLSQLQFYIEEALNNSKTDIGFADYIAAGIRKASNKFIVDVKDEAFNGYFQTYFCYFYPTLSSETIPLTAEMEFRKENEICKVFFKLHTGKHNTEGEPVYKYYSGLMVIVEKTQSCYCILSREQIRSSNELCFLNFRYIPINDPHRTLDCRMVEVLTTSAGGDSSFPTAHRMFISRSPLEPEDLHCLLPHLYLNNSTITIEENELIKVACISENYKNIIIRIISLIPMEEKQREDFYQQLSQPSSHVSSPYSPEEEDKSIRRIMYTLKEDLVRDTASLFLSKKNIYAFISQLRSHSYAFRYNKVSKKLDDNVRKLLLYRGYYSYGDRHKGTTE